MRKTDVEATTDLAGAALAAGVSAIQDMHTGIASRPFRVLGVAAAPARLIHDTVSTAVYAGLRAGLRAAAGLGAIAIPADESPAVESHHTGSAVLAALNGLYGDHLAARGNQFAFGMTVRHDGGDLSLDPDGLAGAFPDATARLVVFVHGLCETDRSWRCRSAPDSDPTGYGDRLHNDLGFTPLYLRYNTGLHVSENGRALAGLLDELVRGWPVPVRDVALVGHSMGGLVARSACHYGRAGRQPWTDAVRHVFCLGSPHLGADLEKGTNVLAWALAKLPETRSLAGVLNARSAGIKDLRFGSCADEDWCDCNPDEFLRDRCQEVPFLPGAHYYFIAATLNPQAVGQVFGDLLVRLPSASGQGGTGRRIPFEVEHGHHVPGLHHFDLLNHPAVYRQMHTWLTRHND